MPGWNFADVWEIVAQQVPDAPAQVQGDRRVTWAEFDRRANGVAQALLDAGVAGAGQGRPVPLQRPRVPRVDVRHLQGRPGARSTPTTATSTTSSSTSGTTATWWPSCSTAPSPSASRASATACPACKLWLWVDDGAGPCPDWATPYEAAAEAGTAAAVPGPVGPRRRPPAAALHGRHHRHAQGRDVAPGRPLPHPRRHLRAGRARRRARAEQIIRDAVAGPGLRRAARPARSCTAPAASPS